MTVFDPNAFLASAYEAATDSKLIACPEGEYPAQITKLTPRFGLGQDKITNILEVQWEILDETVKQFTGLEHVFARQTCFLDLTSAGTLDMSKGKNISIGKLREAFNQNNPAKQWAPSHMMGQMGRVKVFQEIDPNDPEQRYARINNVTRI